MLIKFALQKLSKNRLKSAILEGFFLPFAAFILTFCSKQTYRLP